MLFRSAELGAEVVKVEPPGGELGHTVLPRQRGTSVLYISVNLGKRGIILDFKDAKALDTAYRLEHRSISHAAWLWAGGDCRAMTWRL